MKHTNNLPVHNFGRGKGKKINKRPRNFQKRSIRRKTNFWFIPKGQALSQTHSACNSCVVSYSKRLKFLFPSQSTESIDFLLLSSFFFCIAQDIINSCEKIIDLGLIEQVLQST